MAGTDLIGTKQDSYSLQLPSTPTEWEERLKLISEVLHKAKTVPTPKDEIDPKSLKFGYDYAKFEYMLAQMDKFHPHRSEEYELLYPELVTSLAWVTVKCKVTDLLTHEVREGIDSHRLTFAQGPNKENGLQYALKNNINLMLVIVDFGNDIKSAMKEAARKAYSGFDICSDLYKRKQKDKPILEQHERFSALCNLIVGFIAKLASSEDEKVRSKVEPTKMWLEDWKTRWKTQLATTADEFIEQFNSQVQKLLSKE